MFGRDRQYRDLSALIGHRDLSGLRALLREGVDPNVRSRRGTRILLEAVASADEGLVQALLDAGADPDAVDPEFGTTALHLAAHKGYAGVVRRLVHRRADVNAADSHGLTPLMLAACGDHAEVADVLLRARANPKAVDTLGRTARDYAVRHQAHETLVVIDGCGAAKGRSAG